MSALHSKERLAEAAGYALLMRLAPMLRHNMAGALQPLTMMATIIEKRLQNPSPDLGALASKSRELKTQARDASSACMALLTWLSPDTCDLLAVAAGVEDATELVMAELSFKGFTVVNKIGALQAELPRKLTRTVYMAALLTLTDAATAPANVVLEAQLIDSELVLTISLQLAPAAVPGELVPGALVPGELVPGALAAYRNLEWEDVRALAAIESIALMHTADRVELRLRPALAANAECDLK